MEAVILSKDQFNSLTTSIEEIKQRVITDSKKPAETYLDNQEFLLLMKISKRTRKHGAMKGNFIFSSR